MRSVPRFLWGGEGGTRENHGRFFQKVRDPTGETWKLLLLLPRVLLHHNFCARGFGAAGASHHNPRTPNVNN